VATHGFFAPPELRSGLSAIRALQAGGVAVLAWDDKETARSEAAKLGAILTAWEDWPWGEVKAVILSPGVPLTNPEPHPIVRRAREAGAPGDARRRPGRRPGVRS